MEKELDQILKYIPRVPSERNYWFVRTEGGQLYNLFLEQGIVAIGYHRIKLPDLSPDENPKSLYKFIVDQVRQQYPDAKRPGLIAKQLITFNLGMKKDDVVIIPSTYTTQLSFGIIQDDVAHDARFRLGEKDVFERKARRVEWVKTVERRRLNPNLFSMFFAHQTISNGQEYADYIDSTMSDFFIKDDKTYLQVRVDKPSDVNARTLFRTCLDLLDLTDNFLQITEHRERTSDVDVKININSPGTVEFIAYSSLAVVALGFLIVGINGGGFTRKTAEDTVELKSQGFLASLTHFLNEKSKRKALDSLVGELKTLEVKDSKVIVDVIKKLVK